MRPRFANDRSRQIQRFEVREGSVDPCPVVAVNSPVELRVTAVGVTYASDAAIAMPGDILVAKSPVDVIAEFDSENETGIGEDEPTDLFLPYNLALPPATAGQPATFEIHGIADGAYSVELISGIVGVLAANRLEGTISAGQIVNGSIRFGSGPAPEIPLLSITLQQDGMVHLTLPSIQGVSYQLERSLEGRTWCPPAIRSRPRTHRWNGSWPRTPLRPCSASLLYRSRNLILRDKGPVPSRAQARPG